MVDKGKKEMKQMREKEFPVKKSGKEEHHSMTIWICPECGTRFTGWSTLKACSKCGYTEE